MLTFHIVSSIDISSGGPSKSICDLALEQAKEGASVQIISLKTENPYFTQNPHKNLNLLFLERKFFKSALTKIIKDHKPDILHGHGLWLMEVHHMAAVARKMNIPYIISPRGMLEPWALNYKRWKKEIALIFYQRKDLMKATCLHATSKMEADNIRKLGFKNPIAVVPNGIYLSEFPYPYSKPPKEKYTLLYLSRIHPKKGIELLIDAWKKIEKEKRKSWQINIAGNGEENYIKSLEQRIKNKGLENEIKYIGPQFGSDKIKVYQQADLFILPTHSENFGMVVAEALTCEVPVITTTGTPWEDLHTHQCGWWVNNDVETLAQTIQQAISLSSEERLLMGERGRQLIIEKYSVEIVATQMIRLYEWILKGGEKPEFVYG